MKKLVLILGGVLVAVIAVGLVWIYKQAREYPAGLGMERFKSATEQLDHESTRAIGNSPKAVELADRMRTIMEAMRDKYFTGASISPIKVHCEINEKSCAFLVLVPGLYRADTDAKQQLAEMAWISAQPLFRHLPERPESLAIGLRDGIPYDVVWKGHVTDDPLVEPDTKHTGINCRTELYPFFAR